MEAAHVRSAAVQSLHLQALLAQWVSSDVEETMAEFKHEDALDYIADAECSAWLVETVEDHFPQHAHAAALKALQATLDLMKELS